MGATIFEVGQEPCRSLRFSPDSRLRFLSGICVNDEGRTGEGYKLVRSLPPGNTGRSEAGEDIERTRKRRRSAKGEAAGLEIGHPPAESSVGSFRSLL